MIQYNLSYTIDYSFEPFGITGEATPADIQYPMVLISDETWVAAGQVLGKLYFAGEGAHVHFRASPASYPASCPMNFFTSAASAEMLALLWRTNPGEQICADHHFNP